MRNILIVIPLFYLSIGCKPSKSLEVTKKEKSTPSSSSVFESPSYPIDETFNPIGGELVPSTPGAVEGAPTGSNPLCANVESAPVRTNCTSSGGAVWNISRVQGNCYNRQLETWCYEAYIGGKIVKGTFSSFCNGRGQGSEYALPNGMTRVPNTFDIDWTRPTRSQLTSTWVSMTGEEFTLACTQAN